MTLGRRIAIIGLDCAPPRLVFEQFRADLPHLSKLMSLGSYAVLRSCHPPITVPAWSCLASGYDAGQLGIYGFRNRRDWGYGPLGIATSLAVDRPRLWDHFRRAGRRSITLGVPQSFPVSGGDGDIMVGCFLSPDKQSPWIHPPGLAGEAAQAAEGNYLLDVPEFRTTDKAALWQRIVDMTRRRFLLAEHLARTKPWDLFFLVEMGTDRLHHAFWHFGDPDHPRFAGDAHSLRWAMRDYYRLLDDCLGRLLNFFPDDVLLVVVSDHGARPLWGGIAVNQWLADRGYLAFTPGPTEPTTLDKLQIDWSRTLAWSEGGYYARLFLNVRGREPQGIVEPSAYDGLRQRLIDELEAIPDPHGQPLGNRVHRPESLFRQCRGLPPDLLCYFGNLAWRSVGSVGWPDWYVDQNDTGPDEANHDWDGIFISRQPLAKGPGLTEPLQLLDIGPSLLAAAGLPVPDDTAGRPQIVWR